MLSDKKIILRVMEKEDTEIVRKWRFSHNNYDYFYEFTPFSKFKNEKWFESATNKNNEINFIIETVDESKPVGMISLVDIDHRNQKAEMGRVLIGEQSERGKGYGKSAINLLTEYAFNHLNIHKLYCEVFEFNEDAINAYKKAGFEIEGKFINHIFKNGKYENVIRLAIFNKKNELCQK